MIWGWKTYIYKCIYTLSINHPTLGSDVCILVFGMRAQLYFSLSNLYLLNFCILNILPFFYKTKILSHLLTLGVCIKLSKGAWGMETQDEYSARSTLDICAFVIYYGCYIKRLILQLFQIICQKVSEPNTRGICKSLFFQQSSLKRREVINSHLYITGHVLNLVTLLSCSQSMRWNILLEY